MGKLLEHADRELKLLGYTGEEPADDINRWMYDGIMELVERFEDQHHSGASAQYAIRLVGELLSFNALTAITNDPDEWVDQSSSGDINCWQNKRQSSCFSYDRAETYYDLDGKKPWYSKFFWSLPGHLRMPLYDKYKGLFYTMHKTAKMKEFHDGL
jgi:hypothetical protein